MYHNATLKICGSHIQVSKYEKFRPNEYSSKYSVEAPSLFEYLGGKRISEFEYELEKAQNYNSLSGAYYDALMECSGGYQLSVKGDKETLIDRLAKNDVVELPVKAYDEFERYVRSCKRAKQIVFDLIACNVGKHFDNNGKKAKFKFVTYTFRENIVDVEMANKELTLFHKRLTYRLTGEKVSFLKYLVVPEKQERGAIHFHVVYFNLPFIFANSRVLKKWKENGKLSYFADETFNLEDIWGNGSVNAKAVKLSTEVDVASYLAKYITKASEGDFNELKEKGELGQKRYFCSRKLLKPQVFKTSLSVKMYKRMKELFSRGFFKKTRKGGELVDSMSEFETYSDYHGVINKISGRLSMVRLERFVQDFLDCEFLYGVNDFICFN